MTRTSRIGRVALGAIAGVAAVVLAGGGAFADPAPGSDPTGDVADYSIHLLAGTISGPTPSDQEIDLTGIAVAHGASTVDVTLTFADLESDAWNGLLLMIDTNGTNQADAVANVAKVFGQTLGSVSDMKDDVECDDIPLTETDGVGGTIVLHLDRDCLGNPAQVRIHAASLWVEDGTSSVFDVDVDSVPGDSSATDVETAIGLGFASSITLPTESWTAAVATVGGKLGYVTKTKLTTSAKHGKVTAKHKTTLTAKVSISHVDFSDLTAKGKVTFYDGSKRLKTVSVGKHGTTKLAIKHVKSGKHHYHAVFKPTSATAFQPSTSAKITVKGVRR